MTTRPIAMLLLGSLLYSVPASADRRTKRRVADVEEKEEKADDDQDGEATSVLPIRLEELIEIAVRQSPELARSKNDRAAAQGQAKGARAGQQVIISADGKVERYATPADVDVGDFQVAAETKVSGSLGISRNVSTGGNIGFQIGLLDSTREYQLPAGLAKNMNDQLKAKAMGLEDGDSITDTVTTIQTQAKLVFTQPLARKFGREVALAEQDKADFTFASATIKTQFAAEEMLRDIVSGYWDLAYAAYEVDTRAKALDVAKKQEEITRLEIRANTQPANALSAVLFEVASREEALLTAKNEWEKKSLELRKKVGLELTRRDIVMLPKDKFEAADDEWDVEDVLKRARKGNRKLAAIILDKRAADVDVKVAKNGMLPQVDLQLSGALLGTGNTTDRAFSATASSDGYQVMAGINVQFEVGGAAKGFHDAALAKRQRLEVDLLDQQRTIDTEVVQAVHAVKSARTRIALMDKSIQLAEDNVKAERANLSAGPGRGATHYTLMQRLTDLSNAQLRKGRAIADYHIAVAKVQFLGGMLLEQYRVNVRPAPRGR